MRLIDMNDKCNYATMLQYNKLHTQSFGAYIKDDDEDDEDEDNDKTETLARSNTVAVDSRTPATDSRAHVRGMRASKRFPI